MKPEIIDRILRETAFVREGGTDAELRCAEYLVQCCADLGLEARIESFPVDMAQIDRAELWLDGEPIPCRGYYMCGNADLEAPLYYLRGNDDYSMSQVKGKIVLMDGRVGQWRYHDLLDRGAVGFITHDGDANYPDEDIDQRELRSYVSKGRIVPGMHINTKSAIAAVKKGVSTAKIVIHQEQWQGNSRNVILDMPGETEETVVFTSHYDSTFLSQGAYDNMSGSIGILGIAEYFANRPHRRSLRFIWCGSEERGLLGSKAYVANHAEDVKNCVLNINLDMIGCIMGKFIACSTAEEKLCHYIEYFANEYGWGITSRQDVYSSDSTPFADAGVPAVSFARIAPHNTATIHNSYDTAAVMLPGQTAEDIDFLCAFADRMVNAARCPVKREIPENIKQKLDEYLGRKRPANA